MLEVQNGTHRCSTQGLTQPNGRGCAPIRKSVTKLKPSTHTHTLPHSKGTKGIPMPDVNCLKFAARWRWSCTIQPRCDSSCVVSKQCWYFFKNVNLMCFLATALGRRPFRCSVVVCVSCEESGLALQCVLSSIRRGAYRPSS